MLAWLERQIPKLVLAPSFIAALIFVYGFIGWTAWVSLTKSKLMPRYDIVGLVQYEKLFVSPRWDTALDNLFIFGGLFCVISMLLGLVLAILLDQKIRTEGVLRTIYLYPMALSLIVTGTAWRWILNPGLGVEATVRKWGFPDFTFDWLVNPDTAIYTVVIAAVWQASGFVMALFLAGLRSVEDEIIRAAQVDGIPLWRIYTSII
ncbi:MAG: carbohydrate ABC transporter permease, partial [Candidatus Puniceispirillaceae bacterium]